MNFLKTKLSQKLLDKYEKIKGVVMSDLIKALEA
jgi:hypothetical protein